MSAVFAAKSRGGTAETPRTVRSLAKGDPSANANLKSLAALLLTGAAGKVLAVRSDETGFDLVTAGSGGVVDQTPDPFTFTDVTGVATGSAQTSNTITVSGLGAANFAIVTVSGGVYYKNGGPATATTTVAINGDTFSVGHTASGSNSTAVNTTLTIGGVSDTFTSTTVGVATLDPSITPPYLTLASVNPDGSSPQLTVELDETAAVGDTLRLYRRNKAGSLLGTTSHVITLSEATDTSAGTSGRADLSLASVGAGTWRFTADISKPSGAYSNLSTILITGPDDIAPTLSAPTKAAIGATSLTLGCTTDEACNLYYVLTTVNSAPSAAQVKAGQDSAGAAAPFSGGPIAATVGVNTFSRSGLTAATTYYVWYMGEDATGNQSTVLSDSFTTAAGGTSVAKLTIGTGSTGAGANRSQYIDSSDGFAFAANNSVGAFCGDRSTDVPPTKLHWEITVSAINAGQQLYMGMADSSLTLGPSSFPSPSTMGAILHLNTTSWELLVNGATAASGTITVAAGDIYAMDYDYSTASAPVVTVSRKVGGTTTVLASAVTLTSNIPSNPRATVGVTDTPTAGTANFGASTFAITPLSGHTGW